MGQKEILILNPIQFEMLEKQEEIQDEQDELNYIDGCIFKPVTVYTVEEAMQLGSIAL